MTTIEFFDLRFVNALGRKPFLLMVVFDSDGKVTAQRFVHD
jgi:hypothetical protein